MAKNYLPNKPNKEVERLAEKVGMYVGRVAVRRSGSFNIQAGTGLVQGISYKYCQLIQRNDGYGYHAQAGMYF